MTKRDVVDSHVHFWDPNEVRYPWLESVPALQDRFGPEDFRLATAPAEISEVVFVECDADPEAAVDEVAFVESLANGTPDFVGAIVAHAPLHLGDRAAQPIEALAARPLVRGVRRLLQDEADPEYCLRPAFQEGVRHLARNDLSMDLCIRHHQLPGVIELARAIDDVRFVLDHVGKPDIVGSELDPWRSQIRELASLENVQCKISGVVTEADHAAWSVADLRPYVEHVIECFGFDRVLYGGDWPVVNLAGGYARWFDAITELTASCSDDELARLFAANARAFYRLQAPDC